MQELGIVKATLLKLELDDLVEDVRAIVGGGLGTSASKTQKDERGHRSRDVDQATHVCEDR
jgi:hypothetical protein